MSQPSFGEEGEIEEHNRDYAASDEERLKALCANIGYISERSIR